MSNKKDIFAPLTSGLGATRRAAMLLLVMMLTTAMAWAQEGETSGTCGDVTWSLTGEPSNYTLTISGTGAMEDYDHPEDRPWNSDAEGIKTIVIENGVTTIGNYAFYDCQGLTSVTIPASVTSIGDDAFFYCQGLTSVTVYAQSCSLGDAAFDGCNLTNIYVFSDYVDTYKDAENWSDYALIITGITGGYCGTTDHQTDVTWSLTGESSNYTLTISGTGAMAVYDDPEERPWHDNAEFIKSVVIENGVTSIGAYAFSGTGLTSVEIPASVTSIGKYAFSGSAMTSIEIPASVTSIGENAFSFCNNLGSVTFAEGSQLKSIGTNAFQSSGLTSITIPASVTSIGENVFHNCNNLASMAVADGNTVYDSRNGCNAIIVNSTNTLIIGCKNSTIPAGVTSIGDYAFYGCTGLTSIVIPASVTSIGMRAFQYCPNLVTVTVYAPSCTLGGNAFLNCNKLANIYVFSDKVASYQAAWSAYASKIKTLPNPHGYCGTTGHKKDVIWVLTGESLTISGTGAMADYDDSANRPWNDNVDDITTIVIENGVTRIGDNAFAECQGLTSVTIPASVTSIGNYAFDGCGVLTSIEIPASVTSIGNYAFYDTYLTKVSHPLVVV